MFVSVTRNPFYWLCFVICQSALLSMWFHHYFNQLQSYRKKKKKASTDTETETVGPNEMQSAWTGRERGGEREREGGEREKERKREREKHLKKAPKRMNRLLRSSPVLGGMCCLLHLSPVLGCTCDLFHFSPVLGCMFMLVISVSAFIGCIATDRQQWVLFGWHFQ